MGGEKHITGSPTVRLTVPPPTHRILNDSNDYAAAWFKFAPPIPQISKPVRYPAIHTPTMP